MSREGWARPVVLVWLLVAGLSGSLLLKAALLPPEGTVFVGTFYYVDDFYNYLSYVQQAEEGALVFRNKLAAPSLPPGLLNLEWLAVGWLSALLGGHPIVAYRVFGLVAALAVVALVDHWLRRSGLHPARRLPALLLVMTGGGLGAVFFGLGWLPVERALDLRAGLYPFLEILANPHFVAGTALLLAALSAFAAGRPGRGVALGTVLGLVRPYDVVVLAGVVGISTLLTQPARRWPSKLLPLAGLLPVIAWNLWLFFASPGFRAFSSALYARVAPGPRELALALGPAAVLALTALRAPKGDHGVRVHRTMLVVWAASCLVVGILQPVAFWLQFLVGVGVPVLALAAVGLSWLRRGALEAAVPLLAGTSVMAAVLASFPSPMWHVPESRWRAVEALDSVCKRGDLLIAPPDIGLYAGGLTPCWPFVSHAAAAEFPLRDAAARQFYAPAPGAWRSRFLEESAARAVVLPRPRPAQWDWSPEAAGFEPLPGEAPGDVGVFVREGRRDSKGPS